MIHESPLLIEGEIDPPENRLEPGDHHLEPVDLRAVCFVRAPAGRVNHDSAPAIYAALDDALSQDWPEVVLDLRQVTGFDDDGVSMITHAWGVAQERGVRFKLVDGAGPAMRLLRAAPVHRNVDLVQPRQDLYS